MCAELARLTPDTRQQAVGRSVATATAMAVQRASYAVCEGVLQHNNYSLFWPTRTHTRVGWSPPVLY